MFYVCVCFLRSGKPKLPPDTNQHKLQSSQLNIHCGTTNEESASHVQSSHHMFSCVCGNRSRYCEPNQDLSVTAAGPETSVQAGVSVFVSMKPPDIFKDTSVHLQTSSWWQNQVLYVKTLSFQDASEPETTVQAGVSTSVRVTPLDSSTGYLLMFVFRCFVCLFKVKEQIFLSRLWATGSF